MSRVLTTAHVDERAQKWLHRSDETGLAPLQAAVGLAALVSAGEI